MQTLAQIAKQLADIIPILENEAAAIKKHLDKEKQDKNNFTVFDAQLNVINDITTDLSFLSLWIANYPLSNDDKQNRLDSIKEYLSILDTMTDPMLSNQQMTFKMIGNSIHQLLIAEQNQITQQSQKKSKEKLHQCIAIAKEANAVFDGQKIKRNVNSMWNNFENEFFTKTVDMGRTFKK